MRQLFLLLTPQSLLQLEADPTHPESTRHETDIKPAEYESWLSLNSFIAQLLGAGVVQWNNFPIWQIRIALEDSTVLARPAPGPRSDMCIRVACEWLVQAGRVLLRMCLLSSSSAPLDDEDKRSLSGRDLWKGKPPGYSLQRWGFWQQRLEELKGSVVGEDAKTAVDEAVAAMSSAEADAGKAYGEALGLPELE